MLKKKSLLALFLILLCTPVLSWYNDAGNDSCLVAYSDQEVYTLSPGQTQFGVTYRIENNCGETINATTATYFDDKIQKDASVESIRTNSLDVNWGVLSSSVSKSELAVAPSYKAGYTAKGKASGVTLPKGTSYLRTIMKVPLTGKQEEFTLTLVNPLDLSQKTILDPWYNERGLFPFDYNVLFYEPFNSGNEDANWSGDNASFDDASGYLEHTGGGAHDGLYIAIDKFSDSDLNIFYRTYMQNATNNLMQSWFGGTTAANDPNDGYFSKVDPNNNYNFKDDAAATDILSASPTFDEGLWYDINISRSADGAWFAYSNGSLIDSNTTTGLDYNAIPYLSLTSQVVGSRFDEIVVYRQTTTSTTTIFEPTANGVYADSNVHIKYNLNTAGSCEATITDTYPGTDANVLFTGTVTGDANNSIYRNLFAGFNHRIRVDADCVAIWADVNVSVDNNAPVLTLDLNYTTTGFVTDANAATLNLKCTDDLGTNIRYFLSANEITQLDNNYTNGSNQQAEIVRGSTAFSTLATCTDEAGNSVSDANVFVVYLREFLLIDEVNGGVLDLADVNGLIAYSPDQNQTYDFKEEGDVNIFYLSGTDDRIRFEITYDDGETIDVRTRNFSMSVLDLNVLRVCVPPFYPVFYDHFLLSSTQKSVALHNPYRDCYIIADRARFTFETSYISGISLIEQEYNLYIWDGNITTVLGTIDGAIESTINIDAIQTASSEFDLIISNDGIHISKTATDNIQIYYKNLKENNSLVTFTIYDDLGQIWTYTETSNPDEVTINFNYATIDITGDMLRLVVEKTLIDGSKETFTQYFTLDGAFGIISSEFAIIAAFVLIIFSLTLVGYRFAMGWFGIIACIIAIGILTMATPTWYIVLGQAVSVIVIIFIVLIYRSETAAIS